MNQEEKIISALQAKPRAEWQEQTRQLLRDIAAADNKQLISNFGMWRSLWKMMVPVAAFSFLLFSTALFGYADGATPQDILYPFDRMAEKIELFWAEAKGKEHVARVHLQQAEERAEELAELLDAPTDQKNSADIAELIYDSERSLVQAQEDFVDFFTTDFETEENDSEIRGEEKKNPPPHAEFTQEMLERNERIQQKVQVFRQQKNTPEFTALLHESESFDEEILEILLEAHEGRENSFVSEEVLELELAEKIEDITDLLEKRESIGEETSVKEQEDGKEVREIEEENTGEVSEEKAVEGTNSDAVSSQLEQAEDLLEKGEYKESYELLERVEHVVNGTEE